MTNKDEMPLKIYISRGPNCNNYGGHISRKGKSKFPQTEYHRHDHPDYISKAELRGKLEELLFSVENYPESNELLKVGHNNAIKQIIEEYLK